MRDHMIHQVKVRVTKQIFIVKATCSCKMTKAFFKTLLCHLSTASLKRERKRCCFLDTALHVSKISNIS